MQAFIPLAALPVFMRSNRATDKADDPTSEIRLKPVYEGSALETKFIQTAIDTLSANGGGKVVLAAGDYLVGSIQLKHKIHVHFEQGARLLATPDSSQYHPDSWKRVLYGFQISYIEISGYGEIDCRAGFEEIQPPVRPPYEATSYVGLSYKNTGAPRPFFLHDCHHCKISDIFLQNSGEWSCYILASTDISIYNIKILNRAHSRWTDGIDIESSHHVHISHCDIDTGDDAISIKSAKRGTKDSTSNVIIQNCVLASETNGIRLGTETSMDIYNITIENCLIKGPSDIAPGPFSGINLTNTQGYANISNLTIRNIKMIDCRAPIFIALQAETQEYFDAGKIGTLKNILIENIDAENFVEKDQPDLTSVIVGSSKQPVENVILRNLQFTIRGDDQGQGEEMAEVIDSFSSVKQYHPAPAKGLYLRNVEGIIIENFKLREKSPDARPAIFKNNVIGNNY